MRQNLREGSHGESMDSSQPAISKIAPGKRTLVDSAMQPSPHADKATESARQKKPAADSIEAHSAQHLQEHSNAKWPDGPTVDRKSEPHSYHDYHKWLVEVDGAYPDRENAISRLRRLYYSGEYDGTPLGGRFDNLIITNNHEPPMTVPRVSQATLNGLFSTNFIITPNGSRVDPSHIFADLDLNVSGATEAAEVYNDLNGNISFNGLVTWTGDLSSWLIEYQAERNKRGIHSPDAQRRLLFDLVGAKASKADILGDIDAEVMTQQFLPSHEATKSVAGMFRAMYGSESQYGPPSPMAANSSTRFHYFVACARPKIPHKIISRSPLRVEVNDDAFAAISDAIQQTADFLNSGGYYSHASSMHDSGEAGASSSHPFNALLTISHHFVVFLKDGLKNGNAAWPKPG